MSESPARTSDPSPQSWHAMPAGEVVRVLNVEPRVGLSSVEAQRRLIEHGPNRLEEPPLEPRWRVFLRQFQGLLIIILLIAAAVSLLVSRELETPLAITIVVFLNATIGYVQETRAEASLQALEDMSVATATVRRDGSTILVNAEDLVPGDVIVVRAGDRVPADGRLLTATSLDVQESSLTGEAHSVAKAAEDVIDADASLAEHTTAVFMNSSVTRGRGEVVVTATGMATETGRIADQLLNVEPAPTPLQRQIDDLSRALATIAGLVVVLVFAFGIQRGQEFDTLLVTAASLGVAAIPEGLPTVVAFTLAIGGVRLAKGGAIVKRLASVETLGSTSQICTDKTGTLTLNQMTAREMVIASRRLTVSGQGYSTDGRIRTIDGSPLPSTLGDALSGLALCTDAELHDGEVVGDPTEGALVVLAEKGGIDVAALREERPRVLEIPFDSDHKFMATFHCWTDHEGRDVVRCYVKGAADVLAGRAGSYVEDNEILPWDTVARSRIDRAIETLAEQGMRVMAVGIQDFSADGFESPDDPKDLVDRIVLIALVGIVDPPRPEARKAIAQCRDAGIRVRMITGDHAATASAIAAELGISGGTVTGSDLDRVEDDELADWLEDVGVVARVTPAHKIRIVRTLQARDQVVAMTGDGANDAPALRRADIGVAMGVTGTEVAKDAGTMVLTDDNFMSIVRAVRLGRGIYDNIVKFTRFQISTALGFVIIFLLASLTGIAGGAPFTALQILFVNLVMDSLPAMSLGVDPVSHDAMNRPPRPARERILSGRRLIRILLTSTVMAAGTLAVLVWAPGPEPRLGEATVAGTMAFVTFVIFQAFNLLNVRHDTRSLFSRETIENYTAFAASGAVIVVLVLIVEAPALQGFFTVTDLTMGQWLSCAAVGSSILVIGELVKAALRVHSLRQAGGHTARAA